MLEANAVIVPSGLAVPPTTVEQWLALEWRWVLQQTVVEVPGSGAAARAENGPSAKTLSLVKGTAALEAVGNCQVVAAERGKVQVVTVAFAAVVAG